METRQALVLCLLLSFQVASGSDFGNSGLITVPSARHKADGSLTATISSDQVANLFNITYQATPWLETTFRYTIFNPYDREFSRDTLRDRSYEVKLRLLNERKILPQVSIGVRDILGTGVWSAEYLVASKKFGGFDATLGIGWGRLGEREGFDNPLSFLSDSFDRRPSAQEGGRLGGKIRGATFFRGQAAYFGGIRYSLTSLPISATLEYSSDEYRRESFFGSLKSRSPYSAGLTWHPNAFSSLTLSRKRGEYWSMRLTSSLDLKSDPPRRREYFASAEDSFRVEQEFSFLNLQRWYDRLLFDAESSGLKLLSAHQKPGSNEVTLEIENSSYALTGDAVNQAFVLSDLHLPRTYKSVRLLLRDEGLLGPTIEYWRDLGGTRRVSDSGFEADRISVLEPRELRRKTETTIYGYPRLATGADFALRLQLMDPLEPMKHQLFAKLSARLLVSENINVRAALTVDVDNNFNTRRPSDSVLPRVRSEINRYLSEGENGVDSLYAEFRDSLTKDLHVRSYFGIFEEMFGGIGSEVLYEPFRNRWALGANLNWVKQRDYDRGFEFLDYEVLTGHVSAFYATPWYDFDIAIHAGRYLAGDTGVTYEARRTFDNGFSIGAFFTRTNVSAEEFGEGSFDKGLFLQIPIAAIFPINTRSSYRTVIRSLERDGGRRLEDFVGNLWWSRRALRPDALSRQVRRMHP